MSTLKSLAGARGLPCAVLGLMLALACAPAQPPPSPQSAAAAQSTTPAPQSAAPAAPAAPAGPTRFTLALTDPITSFNSYSQSGGQYHTVWRSIFEALIRLNGRDKTFEPLVAERWEILGPTTWRFYLRQNARFSDGSPVTAADVKHSIDRALTDPETAQGPDMAKIQSATIVDDYTIDIQTKQPDAVLLEEIRTAGITSKAQYDRLGKEAADRQPISAGPYTLHELIPSERMVLKKNPYYWGDNRDAPDEVVIRWIREPEVRLTALLNGEVDMTAPLPPHLVPRLTGDTRAQVAPSAQLLFLGMTPSGPFANLLVRQAIAHAIDKDAIVQGILRGQARQADGPLPFSALGYAADITPTYPYDPARSRQLLAQAGLPAGFQTELYTPIGRYANDVEIANAIAAMLGQVGIQATVRSVETTTFLAQQRQGAYPFYLVGGGGIVDPSRHLQAWFRSGASRFLGGWSDPQVDELLDAQAAEFDPAKRAAILRDLQGKLNAELPIVPLLSFLDAYGISNRFEWNDKNLPFIHFDQIKLKPR